MKKTLNVVRYALVSLFSFLFIGSAVAASTVVSGDNVTVTVATTNDGNCSYTETVNKFCLPAANDLPAGTMVKINTITIAQSKDNNDDVKKIKFTIDGVDYVSEMVDKSQGNWTWTGEARVKRIYVFTNGPTVAVGQTYNGAVTWLNGSNGGITNPRFCATQDTGRFFGVSANGGKFAPASILEGVIVPPPPATTISSEVVTVSDINNATDFASCGSTDTVIVNLTAAKTLEFNAALKFGGAKIVYDGALKLLGSAAPADFAKFNFAGVTSLDYAWLPVGSGMAINFRHNGEGLGDDEDAGISGLTIYGKCWNNGGASGNVEAKMFAPGGDSVIADTMSVAWSSGNTWHNDAATSPLLRGYLDDSNITFSTTVPFGCYDVYIICTTDNGNSFLYKTVNGIAYIAGANGVAVEKASVDTWGNPSVGTPVLGSNVMKLSGLTSKSLTITSPNAAKPKRGCIAAIVIVKAEPPAETVKATIAENTTWSALWATALTANTPVELTFTGSATLTIDTEVVAKDIKIFGNATTAQTIALGGDEANVSAFLEKVTTIDDSASTASTTFDFNVGAMPVKAGANTIVKGVNNGNLTIDSGKKLTVKSGALTASAITNDGTLNFEGGSEDAPIAVTGDKNLGKVTLGENTFVKYDDKGAARLYDITGSGATSVFTIARNGAGSPGFTNGSNKFNNVIVESVATGGNTLWFEHTKPVSDTVGLKLTGNIKISDDTPDPVVVRSITGSGTLDRNGNLGLSIKNMENAEFAGACNFPITVDASEFTQTFSGNFTGALTVNAGGKVKLSGSAKPSSMTINGEVTIDATDGDIVVSGTVVNNGTIKVVGGNVIFMPGTANGTITTEGAGKVLYGYTVNINDCGKFTIPADKTVGDIRLFDAAGNPIEFTDNQDGTVSYKWEVTGGACWWDYEFDGNLGNAGTSGHGAMKQWGVNPAYTDGEGNKSLYIHARPAIDLNNWPTTATFVMYSKMVNSTKMFQLGFGSSTSGTKKTIFLATEDSLDTVSLNYGEGQNKSTKLCTMTVPNAQVTEHLYAFVLKEDDTQTIIDIYLDGELLQSYPFGEKIALGNGFQIGSPHGGMSVGYAECNSANDLATLDWLRVYDVELTKEVLEKYAVLYPYVSPNGSYQRTVTADANWSATGAWTKEGIEPAETADAPAAGATAKLSIDNKDATTTIAINLADDVTYEAIQINGDDVKFVLAAGEDFGGIVKSTGRVTANANITFAYDAFSMENAPLTVKQGKTVTFDLSMVDMAQYFSTQTYDLTGYLTLEDGAKVTFIVPEDLHGREASAAIDPITQHYVLTVTAPDYAFVYENGTWTWGTQVVDEETINAHPEVLRSIKSDLEMALGTSDYSVEDGVTLKQADASATGTITVNAGGTFDVNGVIDTALNVVLNGGSLVNTGSGVPVGNKQYVSLSQTAASTIGGSAELAYVKSSFALNTLDLGDATLTKDNGNTFTLCNTTVQNGTLEIAGGKLVANRATTFANTAALTIDAAGTLEVAADNNGTLTVGAITGVEGATLNNAGTITDFTLTGALKLAGTGTFGTITLDDAALDIATVRGLTIAGEGSIAATITTAEMAGGSLTVFTKAAGATISTVTLVDESGEVLSGYTADYDEEGNYIADFTITFTVPAITGATPSIAGYTIAPDGSVTVPYGASVTLVYTADSGKLFSDGSATKTVPLTNITDADAATLAITTAIDGVTTADAEAQIDSTLYLTLADAFAVDGQKYIILLKNVELTDWIVVDSVVALELNGFTISQSADWSAETSHDHLFCVTYGGTFSVLNAYEEGGTIDATGNGDLYGAIKMTKKGDVRQGEELASLTVFSGTIIGNTAAISGNGTRHGTSVTIGNDSGDTLIKAVAENDSVGIFNPQDGEVIITGGTIEGAMGIIMKSGSLLMTGGKVVANGECAEWVKSNNGFNNTGDAIEIDNIGYPGKVATVSISNDAIVESANGAAVASHADGAYTPITGFIAGGKFKGVIDTDTSLIATSETGIGKWTTDADGYKVPAEDPAMAKIGSTLYLTLAEAVTAAVDNDEVELLASCAGDGIKIDKSITIDFGGFTYTVDASLVGSPSTQSQAFNLVRGNTITLKNGTIASKVARMLVQNYASLTLEAMILDGSELAAKNGKGNDYVAYTLSNCAGDTVITGDSVIKARVLDGQTSFAFDTYYQAGKYEDATVTVDGATIDGDVELAGGSLTLTAGTLNGELVEGSNIEKGTVTKADAFTAAAPEGYLWDADGKLVKITLPTATVEPITAEGYEAVVEFATGDIGVGYNDWNAKFILIPNVAIGDDEIKLGGSYAAYEGGKWVDLTFPACEANEEIDVLGLGGFENITVETVFETIQSFKCGVKNIGLKNDATFTLKLVITDGETTTEICSIDNLTVEAKAIEPVDPEDPKEYDTEKEAQDAADKMNGEDGTIKPEYINAPAGFEGDKAAYAALFTAVAEGNTVTVKLTEDAQAEIATELKDANEATILTPDEEGKATITAQPGLFYGIAAEDSLGKMSTAKGQNWVMATGTTVKVEVPVVTDEEGNKAKAAFFRPTCAVKAPAAE